MVLENQQLTKSFLYPEPGSNRHSHYSHWCLRPARLPIPPSGRDQRRQRYAFFPFLQKNAGITKDVFITSVFKKRPEGDGAAKALAASESLLISCVNNCARELDFIPLPRVTLSHRKAPERAQTSRNYRHKTLIINRIPGRGFFTGFRNEAKHRKLTYTYGTKRPLHCQTRRQEGAVFP